MMVSNEFSMIVSSDPSQGATQRSVDGAYFDVSLEDSLRIPKEAVNVQVSVEESSIWWSIPNIITGKNDKIYVTGQSGGSTVSHTAMGFSFESRYSITGNAFEITRGPTIDNLPVGSFIVGDVVNIDTGAEEGFRYEILSIVEDDIANMRYTVTNTEGDIEDISTNFSRIRLAGPVQTFVATIPQGLYDLSGLNQAIGRELELLDARSDPDSLITLNADEATQKVEVRFNYQNVSIDFTQLDTFREILGFEAQIYGPFPTAPLSLLAPQTAEFNQVNYFLIHSDLVSKGIRFNNKYDQTIGQVLIDVPPGSQITSSPRNPALINAQELAGATRTNLRFWLTDDKNRRVNTNGEYYSTRIVIRYLMPYIIDATTMIGSGYYRR